jgi:steroid delta-isomerase-like uncharacterized protein
MKTRFAFRRVRYSHFAGGCRRLRTSRHAVKIRTMTQPAMVINRFIEEALNAKNLKVLDEIVADNFVEEEPLPGQRQGREGLRDVLKGFLLAFPDIHWSVEEQICEGDKVVTRFIFTGTHNGEFLGVKATGKRVKVWGVVIDLVQNGKMSRSRIIMDVAGLMGQLQG